MKKAATSKGPRIAKPGARKDLIVFFKDGKGEIRWRVVSGQNGLTLAASSEGYRRLADAEENARRVVRALMNSRREYQPPLRGPRGLPKKA